MTLDSILAQELFSHINIYASRYEVVIISYSIIFAEAFPTKWELKGAGRRVFNEFWKFGAMFIVLIYLCNLRSHLIRTIKVPPAKSFKDLSLPQYTYKVLLPSYMIVPGMPDYIHAINKQGRFVTTIHGKLSKALVFFISTAI